MAHLAKERLMSRVLLNTGRILAVGVLIYLVGAMGGWRLALDIHPPESMPQRYAQIALIYILGSAFVGLLMPRHWYIAVLTLWGPVLYCAPVYYYVGRPGLLL